MANSTHAHTHEHAEHVLPLRVYFGVFAALLVLTAVTVIIAKFHFGAFNLIVAMAVAAVKASLVALIFMHLKYDNKVYMLIFVSSIVFLAIFIIFTMSDTMTRGNVDPMKARPIDPRAIIYQNKPEGVGVGTDTTALTDTAATANPTRQLGDEPTIDTIVVPDARGGDTVPVDVAPADTTQPQTAPDSL